MKAHIHILMTLMMLAMPAVVRAQWGFDVASVEAYITDHKNQRSLLLARATLEQSNNLLHEYSAKAAEDYKVLNFDLDKYTRAFDVMDVLYRSLRTSMNVYSTYQTVSDRISDSSKVLKRNRLALQDTVIIRISLRCIDRISAEGKGLYRSVSDLVLYATGAAACSTSDLMLVLESINTSLDNIKKLLNAAYFDTWRYIQVRILERKYLHTPFTVAHHRGRLRAVAAERA